MSQQKDLFEETDDRLFKQWMENVDAHFTADLGLTSDDLPDQCYYELFKDGYTPREVVDKLIEDQFQL